MSRPFMPFYDGDFLRDTAHLSPVEGWAYLHLIMHYWANGSLPSDPARLARIAKMSLRKWHFHATILASFFDADWKHKRIDKELDKYEKFCEKQRANAASGIAKRHPKDSQASSQTPARAPVPYPEPIKEKIYKKENGEDRLAENGRELPIAPPWHQNQQRFLGSNGVLWIDGKPYRPRT